MWPPGTIPYALTWTLSSITNSNMTYASLVNVRGAVVEANSKTVLSAVTSVADASTGVYNLGKLHPPHFVALSLISSTHNTTIATVADAWPITVGLPFLLPLGAADLDCVKTKALVDWIYWTQTSSLAYQLAEGYVFLF